MATLNDLLPEVLVECDECSRIQAERAMQATLRHFCRETHYWHSTMPPITLLPFNISAVGTYLYTVEVPPDTDLLDVQEFVYNGELLQPVSVSWLDETLPKWREMTGNPRYYLMMSDRAVRFIPHSQEVQPVAISGEIVLMPSRRSENFSDDLLEYDQGLINGTLFRLLPMKKPWMNTQRAQLCKMQYDESVSLARLDVMRSFSHGPEMAVTKSWL